MCCQLTDDLGFLFINFSILPPPPPVDRSWSRVRSLEMIGKHGSPPPLHSFSVTLDHSNVILIGGISQKHKQVGLLTCGIVWGVGVYLLLLPKWEEVLTCFLSRVQEKGQSTIIFKKMATLPLLSRKWLKYHQHQGIG